MCLLLKRLWIWKGYGLCRNLSERKYFPITVNIFPTPKIWKYFFFYFAKNRITENNQNKYNMKCIIYSMSLWLILGNVCIKRERSEKITSP